MPPIDAMGLRLVQPCRARRHAGFHLDHFAGRIPRKLDLACLGIGPLALQLDQRRRCHDGHKGVLERLRVVVDVAMQRSCNVVPIEHALFGGDDRKNLLRLLADQHGVPLRRFLIKPGA